MSNPNAQIYGSANFYDQSENGGVVSNATFHDNALNSGVITLSGVFNDAATNDGTILSTAVFTGISTNNGIVRKIAIFTDSAVNSETAVIQGNANFSSGTVNNGVLQGTNSGAGGLVDHAYHQGSYWSNVATLELGDTVYLYRYENVKASNVTISSPGLTAEINSQGIVTSITRIDHPNRHSIYWSDDAVLSIGSSLYPSRYTNTLAGSGNFTAAGYIVTFVNGLVTQIQAAELLDWYDDTSSSPHTVTLNGSVTQSDEGGGVKAALFDGNAANYLSFDSSDFGFGTTPFTWEAFVNSGDNSARSTYNFFFGTPDNGSIFYREKDDQQGSLVFNGQGQQFNWNSSAVTRDFTNKWNHIAASFDGSTMRIFVNGVMDFSGAASSITWGNTTWIGADGFGPTGYVGKITNIRVVKGTALYTSDFTVPTTLPTAVSGTQLLLNFGATAVPTVTVINHQYQHDAYWSDDATLANGSILYEGQHNNSTANSITQFTEGDYYVNTNGSGVVSLTYVITHTYQYDAYWSDDATLANGSILYTGQHTSETANNISQFTEGEFYVDTNSSGVVNLTYVIDHPYSHGSYYSDDATLANGSILYTGQHTNSTANSITQFTEGEFYVNTNSSGVVNLTYVITHTYSHGSYYSDDATLANGSILYEGQHNNSTANSITQFTEGDYYVNTNGSGVVTLSTYNGAYSHGYYNNSININTGYSNSTPQQAQDDSNYYTYSSGVATAASGYYSDGYYSNGAISGAGDTGTPTQAQDNSNYYTYSSGVATYYGTGNHGNGAYSDGYYSGGVIDTNYTDSMTPQQAQDNSNYYTYSSGVAVVARGCFNNSYYAEGVYQGYC